MDATPSGQGGRRRGARGARAASTARSARSPSRPPRRCCPSSAAPSTSGRRRANGRPGAFAPRGGRGRRPRVGRPRAPTEPTRRAPGRSRSARTAASAPSRTTRGSARRWRALRKPVLEEELGGAFGGLPRPVSPVAAQYSCRPHRRRRLVEGRAVAACPSVAVPAAVRPAARPARRLASRRTRVVGAAEPAADRECVALLRRAAPRQPVDDLDAVAMALTGEPSEDGLRSRETARLAGRGRQAPTSETSRQWAPPFRVDMRAAAVRLLACEQAAHLQAFEDPRRLGGACSSRRSASPARRSPARPTRAASRRRRPSRSRGLVGRSSAVRDDGRALRPDSVTVSPNPTSA